MYLVFIETVIIDEQKFWEGVSFEYTYDEETDVYTINYNDKDYVVDQSMFIKSDRPTRTENVSAHEYHSMKRNDKTKDYMSAVKKAYNIDMKVNYEPQFRDGKNPFKDANKKEEEYNQSQV